MAGCVRKTGGGSSRGGVVLTIGGNVLSVGRDDVVLRVIFFVFAGAVIHVDGILVVRKF